MIKVEVKNNYDYGVQIEGTLGVICTQLAAIIIGIKESVSEEEAEKLIDSALSISEGGRASLEFTSRLAIEHARSLAGKEVVK